MPRLTLALRPSILLALCAAGTLASHPAAAQDLRPAVAFVQAGSGEDEAGVVSAGVRWPWAWRTTAWGGEWTGATELFGSWWHTRDIAGGHQGIVQVGLVPVLRYRLSQGRSPWFAEIGIGLSITDKRYQSPNKTFSTRWNFSDNLAVGRSFGARNEHELSLRWQHTSNGGAKKPNPGLDLVMLRYARAF